MDECSHKHRVLHCTKKVLAKLLVRVVGILQLGGEMEEIAGENVVKLLNMFVPHTNCANRSQRYYWNFHNLAPIFGIPMR